jgi:adenylate cyclase class IV
LPANVEIKARARDFGRQTALARALGDTPGEWLHQEDTFFALPGPGRLKLRVFSPRRGELIYYERTDDTGPRKSTYVISPTHDPGSLHQVLVSALGVLGIVRKRRLLIWLGQTRIHLDEVEHLGQFIELEVVLRPDQEAEEGAAIVSNLMRKLEIRDRDLIATAYLDLLTGPASSVPAAGEGPGSRADEMA